MTSSAQLTGAAAAAPANEFVPYMAASALESMAIWLEPFDSKFYQYIYTMMFMKLMATPNMKKVDLVDFLRSAAKVSQSKALGDINLAVENGFVISEESSERPGLELNVSDSVRKHFEDAFNDLMERSAERLERFKAAGRKAS